MSFKILAFAAHDPDSTPSLALLASPPAYPLQPPATADASLPTPATAPMSKPSIPPQQGYSSPSQPCAAPAVVFVPTSAKISHYAPQNFGAGFLEYYKLTEPWTAVTRKAKVLAIVGFLLILPYYVTGLVFLRTMAIYASAFPLAIAYSLLVAFSLYMQGNSALKMAQQNQTSFAIHSIAHAQISLGYHRRRLQIMLSVSGVFAIFAVACFSILVCEGSSLSDPYVALALGVAGAIVLLIFFIITAKIAEQPVLLEPHAPLVQSCNSTAHVDKTASLTLSTSLPPPYYVVASQL